MDRMQVNFRLDKELAARLDQKRAAMMKTLGRIPTRSELLRIALEQFLDAPAKSDGKGR